MYRRNNYIQEFLYQSSRDKLKSLVVKQILDQVPKIAFYTNILHPHDYKNIIGYYRNNIFRQNLNAKLCKFYKTGTHNYRVRFKINMHILHTRVAGTNKVSWRLHTYSSVRVHFCSRKNIEAFPLAQHLKFCYHLEHV